MGMSISLIILPGVIGAIFCAYDRPFIANIIWTGSNLLMAIRSYNLGDPTVALSYLIFQFFAVWGVIRHIKNSRKTKLQPVQKNLE